MDIMSTLISLVNNGFKAIFTGCLTSKCYVKHYLLGFFPTWRIDLLINFEEIVKNYTIADNTKMQKKVVT